MPLRSTRAFSLVELLIALVIIAIVGGASLATLWFAFNTANQVDDYTAANTEIEQAVQQLGREFTLVGLGMPNNRSGRGSFASAFAYPAHPPIMALMGVSGDVWGGPVTVGNHNPSNEYNATTMDGSVNWRADASLPGGGVYAGRELYYAWGIPTGLKARYTSSSPDPTKVQKGDKVTVTKFYTSSGVSGKNFLENFKYESRTIGLQDNNASRGRNPATWLLFPTLRVPLLLEGWTSEGLIATLAADADQSVEGLVMGLDEVHLLQVARLRLNTREELEQIIFGADYTDATSNTVKILAERIVGVHFSYNPLTRLLTMYIAARGRERHPVAFAPPHAWVSWLPALPAEALHYRLAAKSITWRIRN
ncbi:MAG: prepilin-type N-terminal cleavage/methylation domain-containing protein [Synergistaceae bacterium]|jgi:prepilin-type N-terminal cleavage/methylation domain-containing protein|nr:prepilin-type N-terminal cleavage/methylation domain-containing protein [Synergistaceae bacterium]